MSQSSIQQALDYFVGENIVCIVPGETDLYKYAPGPKIGDAIESTSRAYETQRIGITSLIYPNTRAV